MMVAPAARRRAATNAHSLNARQFESPDGHKAGGAFVAGVSAYVVVPPSSGAKDMLRWRFTTSCRWMSRAGVVSRCEFLTNLTHTITLCKEPGKGNGLGIIVAGG
jgi:hypothetical protein